MSSIRNWFSSVDCKPGFLSNVIDELRVKVEIGQVCRDVSIVSDGMSIRKQTQWDRKEQRYTGFVDDGNAAGECNEEMASESLVFMVVGLTGASWKSVIGCFLCNNI